MRHALPPALGFLFVRETLSGKHTRQLGTLGGGNHFVELVYDEEVGVVWFRWGTESLSLAGPHLDDAAQRVAQHRQCCVLKSQSSRDATRPKR